MTLIAFGTVALARPSDLVARQNRNVDQFEFARAAISPADSRPSISAVGGIYVCTDAIFEGTCGYGIVELGACAQLYDPWVS